MSLPEHIYALTNHCLDIVKQAPSSVHVHVIVVIVIVVIIVVIVVVVIIVVLVIWESKVNVLGLSLEFDKMQEMSIY